MIGRRVSQKSSPVPGVVGGSRWPALPHTSAGYAEADTPIHTTVQGQSVRSLLYIVQSLCKLLMIHKAITVICAECRFAPFLDFNEQTLDPCSAHQIRGLWEALMRSEDARFVQYKGCVNPHFVPTV